MNCGSGVAPEGVVSEHAWYTVAEIRLTHLLSELALPSQIELLHDGVVRRAQQLHLCAGHMVAGCDMRSCTTTESDGMGAQSLCRSEGVCGDELNSA
jgi:hypothetical protein